MLIHGNPFFIVLSAFVSSPQPAHAATIYVGPSEAYKTIQAGIDAAVNGDRVIVRDGTYSGGGNRAITFNGKAITVKSQNGRQKCIVDGAGWAGNGFELKNGETSKSVISGFTIKNFSVLVGKGGIGIYCFSSSPTITNCTISGNSDDGIYCNHSYTTITNSILWGNASGEITVEGTNPRVTYSCVKGGYAGEGNINTDPLFFNAASGVFHIKPNSPCIDAGSPDISGLPETDKDGNPRIVRDLVDMGAYEYCPSGLPTIAFGVIDGQAAEKRLNQGKLAVLQASSSAQFKRGLSREIGSQCRWSVRA